MPRTTIDLDSSVLDALKERQHREHKTLGQVASELLARALAETAGQAELAPLCWETRPMHARVDLEDREAVQRILDAET
jgi:hypothetical protein